MVVVGCCWLSGVEGSDEREKLEEYSCACRISISR